MAESKSGGIGVVGLLGVVFVTLKLCGVIDWHWALVTLPFWIIPATILTILLTIALFSLFMAFVVVPLCGPRIKRN